MTLRHVICLSLLAVVALAAAAIAGPPVNGIYQSTDVGGTLNMGRYSEAWDAGGAALGIGTTLHAQSWDGMNLGLEWSYSCGTIQNTPYLISNTVNPVTGNGYKIYSKNFVGGTIWLSGTGPWAGGDAFYSGPILSYTEIETVQYANFEHIHAVTNVSAIAAIEGYNDLCLAFSVANGVEVGSTDLGGVKPADYPTFLAENCDPTRVEGAWWDMMSLSLQIDGCAVGNSESTWGTVKSLYSD